MAFASVSLGEFSAPTAPAEAIPWKNLCVAGRISMTGMSSGSFLCILFRPSRIRNDRESVGGGIVPRSCVYSHTTMFADVFKSPRISCTASRYNNAAINSPQNWQLWAIPLNRAQTQLSANRIPASNGTSQRDKRERSYTPSEAAAERIAHKPLNTSAKLT